MLKVLLKEPLVHFLAIGAVMFVLFGMVGRPAENTGKRIEITKAVINTLVSSWEKQWNRPPTQTELNGLIEKTIYEEILYREALQMGLDYEDSVIRRRLAQKLEFLIQDIASPSAPTDAELQAYLDSHSPMFEESARYTFVQVYLNPDARGGKIIDDARQLLDQLKGKSMEVDLSGVGDRFMLDSHYQDINERQLDRLFGTGFAQQLNTLQPDTWGGPVESGYGLHLVYLHERIPARAPGLAEVRKAVEREWLSAREKEANEQVYLRLRDQYEVVIDTWSSPLVNPLTGS